MKKFLLGALCFLSILVFSCQQQPKEKPSALSNFEFFLPDSIDNDHEHSPITQLRTSALYKALGEPNLMNYDGDKEIYRLKYHLSFSIFNDVVYRMEIDGDTVRIHVNAGSGEIPESVLKHYKIPPGIFFSENRHSTSHYSKVRFQPEVVADSMRSMLNGFDFWNQPAKIDFQGEDGDNYILEAYRDGKYHAIYRWNPVKGREEYVIREIHQLMYDQLANSVLNPDSLRIKTFEE